MKPSNADQLDVEQMRLGLCAWFFTGAWSFEFEVLLS